jgi:hypothetical protein
MFWDYAFGCSISSNKQPYVHNIRAGVAQLYSDVPEQNLSDSNHLVLDN